MIERCANRIDRRVVGLYQNEIHVGMLFFKLAPTRQLLQTGTARQTPDVNDERFVRIANSNLRETFGFQETCGSSLCRGG